MTDDTVVDILLVEDSDEDAELTLRALRKKKVGNRIHRVKDGEEALDYLFARGAYADRYVQDRPRVVLLDLKLPKVDGVEVLRAIRGDARTRTVPVVVLTSSREERDVVETYSLGVNSYIVKPVEFDAFLTAVEQLGFYWVLLNQPPD